MTSPTVSPTASSPIPGYLRLRGVFRYSSAILLVALVLLVVVTPFVEALPAGDLIRAVILTVIMVFAAVVAGGRRSTLAVGIVLVIPALLSKWINHFAPEAVTPMLHLGAACVFFLFVVVQILLFVLRFDHIDSNVLCAAISGYIILGLCWVPAYLMVAKTDPGAFVFSAGPEEARAMDPFNALCYSFSALGTVGFGDITPVSRIAKMLAIVEALAGLFYMAILISRLVSLQTAPPPLEASSPTNI